MTVRTIDEIFRDFVTDGVPASGPFNPHKPDIRDTLKALTEGSENFPDNRVIRLNNANEGTANNIVVTASVAIPAASYQVLYILNVTQENTGPVTVTGAINRDLVTNTSRPIEPGYLKPGMALLCIDTGSELRMLSYGDVEEVVEALAVRAEAAAEAAEAAAGNNWSSFSTVLSVQSANIPAPVSYLRTAGYYAPGDGGGALYKRALTEPTHAGKIQSADGAWWELTGGHYTVEMFGAQATSVDSTDAFKDAADFIMETGSDIEVGEGTYIVTDTILIDYTTSILGKGCFIGKGLSKTEIYTNITSGALFHIKGNWGVSEQFRGAVKGIGVRSEQNAGDGFRFEDISYTTLDRISARGFSRGFSATDAICLTFDECIFTHNVVGIEGTRVNHSGPNAWLLKNCTVNGNSALGALLTKPATLTLIGGTFEGNGQQGVFENGGIYINGNPDEGASGITALGTYFEGNGGDGDVILDCNDADGANHSFIGCTFNRISSTKFVTHPIVVKKTGTGFVGVTVKGCGFRGFNTYTADASRRYVALVGTVNGTNWDFDLSGNYYATATELPDLPGSGASNKSRVGAFVRFNGTTGAIDASHNVESVTRTATGTYTITFKKPMSQAAQCVSITPVAGLGFGYLNNESASSIEIKTFNMSSAATDWNGVSVFVGNI